MSSRGARILPPINSGAGAFFTQSLAPPSRHSRQPYCFLESHLLEIVDQQFHAQVPLPRDRDGQVIDAPNAGESAAVSRSRRPPPYRLDPGCGTGEDQSDFLRRERLECTIENEHVRASTSTATALARDLYLRHRLLAMQMDRNRGGNGQCPRRRGEAPERHHREDCDRQEKLEPDGPPQSPNGSATMLAELRYQPVTIKPSKSEQHRHQARACTAAPAHSSCPITN